MNKIRAKKSLGQHFLIDKNIARNIANSLIINENADDKKANVIEVGGGTGVLTEFLEKQDIELSVVEIDNEAVEILKMKFPNLINKIYHDNFLKMRLEQISESKIHIIGNFPYNISSQIFFKVLENREKVSQVVCMIQKEVASRICSEKGNKVYGIMSVLLQAFYDVEYLFTVSENVFSPPPKVKSAVIRLIKKEKSVLNCNEKLFFQIVKASFNHRRKTIKNSLKSFLGNIDNTVENNLLKMRPEQLGVEEFNDLTKFVENLMDLKVRKEQSENENELEL